MNFLIRSTSNGMLAQILFDGEQIIQKKGAARLPESTSFPLRLRYALRNFLARRCFACCAFGSLLSRREFKTELLTLGVPHQKRLELAFGTS